MRMASRVWRLEERERALRPGGMCPYCIDAALGGRIRRLVFLLGEEHEAPCVPAPCPVCGDDTNDYFRIVRVDASAGAASCTWSPTAGACRSRRW